MPTTVPRHLNLNLSKHVMRNVSRLRLPAHTLKVEEQRGLKIFSCIVTNVLVKMNMFRTRCMLFYFAKTIKFELRKQFSFLFTPIFEDFSAAQPFLLQQVNNQLVHDFLSQQNTRLFLFLSELMDSFVAVRDQSAADQPNNLAEGQPHYKY